MSPRGANPRWTTAKGGNHDDPQAGEIGASQMDGQEQGQQAQQPQAQQQEQGQGQPRTFTQDEVNELMGKVRRETREKYADYDDLAKKAKAYDDAQQAGKTELEKAKEAAAKAERELESLKAEKARSDLAAKVSAATGVPAGLISGADEESMTASANAIAAWAKSASGAMPADKGGAASAKPMTRSQILAIEDESERRRAIADNIELFE